jgi:predicted nucleic acid-binding Zn ribbon protein
VAQAVNPRRGAGRPVPHCLVCGSIISPVPNALCSKCRQAAGDIGAVIRRRNRFYGLDRLKAGRVIVEQDAPRNDEALRIIREHLGR